MVGDLDAMLGRRIVVGLTYCAEDGSVDKKVQFAGVVCEVDPLVVIDVDDGFVFTLPSDTDAYDIADEEGVDFIATWTIHPPDDE
jgi:hypothetical protein